MQVHVLDAIVKGLLVGLFMAISVGPTLFAVIKYSLNYSYTSGLAFVLGVSVSDIMYVTLANLAASWLEYLKPYEKHIAFGGAVALMAIGIVGLIKKQKPQRPSSAPLAVSAGHYFRIWLSGFLVNTLNPGALITWLGAVTLTANTSGFYRFILFGTCLLIILSIDFSKVFLAERIKRLLTIRRIIYLNRFSSACLLFIGLSLFVSTLFNVQFKNKEGKNEMDKILSNSDRHALHRPFFPGEPSVQLTYR
jgi:threonine/homoserine/homoserine lactone efflux protein